ncbi:MAG: hypothetical protein IKS03_09795, partial [Ruminococcus sp.]|nr:hypothetical protein [Ruminococcus sp.]
MADKKVLFKYSSIANTDISDDEDSGFSFSLFCDGTAKYEDYIGFEDLKKLLIFKVDKQLTKKIGLIIENNKETISSLDKIIDNGSCDGCADIFQFYSKEICCYNIEVNDIETIKKNNPKYYQEFYDVMLQENQLIKIFNQICSV